MEYLAKYISDTMAEVIKYPEDQTDLEKLLNDGFTGFIPVECPEVPEGSKPELHYIVFENMVKQVWYLVTDPVFIEKKINSLKKELADSDYKIIKCYEANLLGETINFDVFELSMERQKLREEINRLSNL